MQQILQLAQSGRLLDDELYRSVLAVAPADWCESEPEIVAFAIRQLGAFCDWQDFAKANELLDTGVSTDDLHFLIRQTRDEFVKLVESNPKIEAVKSDVMRVRESERDILEFVRNVERLMGFDRAVIDRLAKTLGDWDDGALPDGLLDLLPQAVTYPLRDSVLTTPYDHRIHHLVRELATRLGGSTRLKDIVLKHCAHLLSELYEAVDEQSAADQIFRQLILLAEDHWKLDPSDLMGLCWRGELASWCGDRDMAAECANSLWDQLGSAPGHSIERVTAFFALAGGVVVPWGQNCHAGRAYLLEGLLLSRQCLSSIEGTWHGQRQSLVRAIVRMAFERGEWSTRLLCSIMVLMRSTGEFLRP